MNEPVTRKEWEQHAKMTVAWFGAWHMLDLLRAALDAYEGRHPERRK